MIHSNATFAKRPTINTKHKRRIHFYLSTVNHWLLLVIGIISTIVCVMALRSNNLTALKLRDQVITADQQDKDVEAALHNLRKYVYAHMNTNLATGPNAIRPPIQLKYRYDRLVKAEQDRVSAANASLYTQAQADCERRYPQGLSGGGRIPCIQEYVSSHGGQQAQPIPDSLYKYDFMAPFWSPDLAGWSMVVAIVCFIMFVFHYGLERLIIAEFRSLT